MIPHIMVQAVLQQSVAGFYTDLVTRPTGRAVRENIERDLPPGTIAVMDFTGVGCLDYYAPMRSWPSWSATRSRCCCCAG